MTWSISAYKTLQSCPREWFFRHIMADGKVKKDTERVEITRLSKLQTIEAWRGSVVDQVISQYIIQNLRYKNHIGLNKALETAKNIFDRQYALASGESINGIVEFEFIDKEFGRTIQAETKNKAWKDVELALNNFFQDDELMFQLRAASVLIDQRPITFHYGSTAIKAIPDLVCFYEDETPTIFDWKVHTFGTYDNDEQMLLYAMALKTCNPHKDFPVSLINYTIEDIKLTEVQLIANETGYKRHYKASDEEVEKIHNLISSSLLRMYGLSEMKKYNDLEASDFEITDYPENCINCPFKQPCKQV